MTIQAPQVLELIAGKLSGMTPQLHKAASWLLEHPTDISISSINELARAANVKPNTLVRLARSCGFDGYDDFREPFKEEIRRGSSNFQDRAAWLQSLSRTGNLGALYADMAASTINNIESTLSDTNAHKLKSAADAIVAARKVYILGVGLNYALARTFSYLAEMALDNVASIPRDGSLAIDDLARANQHDVLLAITFKPFRSEVVDAVEVARAQGVQIIGVSDSAASPVIAGSAHGFVAGTDTPQFFTSNVAAAALLETLMAFVIADADAEVIANIKDFHERRHTLGIYHAEPEAT
jgi:DNA-binding MurR/RpiR family transcriptional regulator